MPTEVLQAPRQDLKRIVTKVYAFFVKRKLLLFILSVCAIFLAIPFLAPHIETVYAFYKDLVPSNSDGVACDNETFSFEGLFDSHDVCRWSGLDGVIVSEIDRGTLRPKITPNFLGGRNIFSPIETSPNFQVTLRFVPQNPEKVNVAINYGYVWRLIVGNGDYNQVVMQRNESPDKKNLGKDDWIGVPERNGNKWFKRNGRLDPKKEIVVNIVSRPRVDSSVLHVNATVSGYIDGEMQIKDFDFDYNVEVPGSTELLMQSVGIGLLDPSHEGIETKLIDFKLERL